MIKIAAVLVSIFSLGGCVDNTPIKGIYPSSGLASWYTSSLTSTGEKFTDSSLTCAMRRNDFGKIYKVCNTGNGKCVVVRHNNFGPSKKMYLKGRIIDLSQAAFSQLSDLKQGLIPVTLLEVSNKE